MKRPIGLTVLAVLEAPPAAEVSLAVEADYGFAGLRLIRASTDEQLHPRHEQRFAPEIASRLSDCGPAAP